MNKINKQNRNKHKCRKQTDSFQSGAGLRGLVKKMMGFRKKTHKYRQQYVAY